MFQIESKDFIFKFWIMFLNNIMYMYIDVCFILKKS